MADFLDFSHKLLEMLFPIECFGCGKHDVYCCVHCLSRVSMRPASTFVKGVTIFTGFSYAEPLVRRVIQDLKYGQLTSSEPAIEHLIKRWSLVSGYLIPENCVLVPVPLHYSKQRMRGFNQAETLARILGKTLDIPVMTNFLFRTRGGVSQVESRNRHKNVVDAFEARTVIDEHIFLIDDVITTGSTIQACMMALRDKDIFCVGGFALARGSIKGDSANKKSGF